MITEETIARMKINLEVKNEYVVLELIKHLEGQIKRMKCCGNCKHREDCVYEHAWDLCEKWELAE